MRLNCKSLDGNGVCDVCDEGTYLYKNKATTPTDAICCSNSAETLNGDGSIDNPFSTFLTISYDSCVPAYIEIDDCLDFHETENKCKVCKGDKYLSNGVCCDTKTFYDSSN